MAYIERIVNFLIELTSMAGPAFGFLTIILESIFPFLPLSVFIALNNVAFGPIEGFLISWIATVLGCCISYYIFKKGFNKFIYRYIKIDGHIHRFVNFINKMDFGHLVLFIAMPFTPAFLINIASGLSNMSFRKFVIAILIGKLSIIYFWGFIGTSIAESFKNPLVLIQIIVLLSITYIISKVTESMLNKKGVKSKWNIL